MTGQNSNWFKNLETEGYVLLLVIILGVGFLFFSMKNCSNKKEFKKEAVEQGTDFKSIIDSKNKEIALQQAKVVESQETINTLLGENTKLKNAKALVKWKTETIYTNVPVPFAEKDTLADSNKITVPKNFNKRSEWFTITGKVTKKGVELDTTLFVQSGRIGIGYKKPQNLKEIFKPEFAAELQSDNPNTRTKSMETYFLDKKLKWYQRHSTWLGVGFGLGVASTIAIFVQ